MNKSTSALDENQRQILSQILTKAFQEIRRLAWEGRLKQAGDLADAFHNIPSALIVKGYWTSDQFTREFSYYQTKYHKDKYPGKFDYIGFLTDNWDTL